MRSKNLNDFWPCPEVETIFSNCYCFGAFALGMTTGAVVAANMALVGTVISTVGMISQGQTAAGNARFQGQVQAQNAELARRNEVRSAQQAKIDEDDFSRKASFERGRRIAAKGKTGALFNQGSQAAVESAIAGEDTLSALRLRNQFAVRTSGFAVEGQNQTAQAGFSANAAKQAATQGLFNAGGQVFKGAQSIGSITGNKSNYKP